MVVAVIQRKALSTCPHGRVLFREAVVWSASVKTPISCVELREPVGW